ncbi:MAG: hypothetical protein MPW15_26915 [Candidatus Manganitrophus sp.]|nr:hypothetical protein [Candidatus Manganitrophus sp.]
MLRHSNPWELYIAVVLSAQTTDKKVNEVTERLFKKYRTLDDYVNADPEEFNREIRQIGTSTGTKQRASWKRRKK